MQRKTKIICILLVLSIITCLCNTAWAESNASYDGRYYQDTDLGETLEIVNNGWGSNNIWVQSSTTYFDGTVYFYN